MSNYIGHYCCTDHQCKNEPLSKIRDGLQCPNGHLFPFSHGTDIPIFACVPENTNEYSTADSIEHYDNHLSWLFSTFGEDEFEFRKHLVARLQLKRGDRVLVTSAGHGNDIPHIVAALQGKGELFVQDFAKEMLLVAASRHQNKSSNTDINLHFSVSDATNLPFCDDYFDALYHFGGINAYSDVAKGIAEMNRVVRPGGIVVFGDKGVAPWLENTEYIKMLIKNNPVLDVRPHFSLLPKNARSVNISWELGNYCYVVDFHVADTPLPINIDIPHVGIRGGSIRSRYYGQLEGVTPSLRDRVYEEAVRKGVSRFEYIETALQEALIKTSEN